MDPNEALREIRSLLHAVRVADDTDDTDAVREAATALADRVEALDAWLIMGGFLPDAWGVRYNVPPVNGGREG